jgi:predicted ATPase
MEDLFPNWQLGFRVTEDGNILLQIKEINPGSGTLTLLPPSIPDGLFKLLLIMTAIEMHPSILLIDEIENSLHDSIIQYVMDSLRESGVTTIVTTHSSMVVDRSELNELRIIEKIDGESIIKSISKPVQMKKKLLELGITPSDSWLYGELA